MKRKHVSLILFFALCLSLLIGSAQLARDSQLNEKLVRLHVIAASDSEEDQCVKRLVRDAVLEKIDSMQLLTTQQAIDTLRASLASLAETAQEVLHREGFADDVQVRLCTEQYPVRQYGSFSLPAGEYVSLQIRLGEAEGQNWWCVVYPGLCHACDEGVFAQAAEAAGFSDGQIRLMTLDSKTVQFRFKLLELVQKLKNFF